MKGTRQSAIGGHWRVAEVPESNVLETNKNAGGAGSRSASRIPRGSAGACGGGWGRSRAALEAGGKVARPPHQDPGCAPGNRPRAPPPRGPGRARTRRGLQVPGSPEAGAGRSLAQFPGIRRAGKRRGGRSGRRATSSLGAGRGRRRGRRGPEPCVPGRGLAGLAAGGSGSGLRGLTAPAARSRLRRRTAGSAQEPRRAGRRTTQRADPRGGRAPGAARPLPRGRPSAPALGARSAAAAWALMAARRGSA